MWLVYYQALFFSDHSVEFSLDNVSTGDIFSNSYICFSEIVMVMINW